MKIFSEEKGNWYDELKTHLFWQCVISELFGSVFYCFAIANLIFNLPQKADDPHYFISLLTTGLVIGFITATISYGFGVIHNAYIFPAITIGQCLMKNCSFLKSVFYLVVQMVGGIIGTAIESTISARENFNVTYPTLNVHLTNGCLYEGIFGFLFVLTMLKSFQHNKYQLEHCGAALLYGVTVSAIFLMGYKLTGAVLNTALVFGIGIFYNHWPHFIWIYWVGPLTGGLVAGFFHIIILFPTASKDPTECEDEERRILIRNSSRIHPTKTNSKYIQQFHSSSYNNHAYSAGQADGISLKSPRPGNTAV